MVSITKCYLPDSKIVEIFIRVVCS